MEEKKQLRKNRIPVRKRFQRPKRHNTKCKKDQNVSSEANESSIADGISELESYQAVASPASSSCSSLMDHDYCRSELTDSSALTDDASSEAFSPMSTALSPSPCPTPTPSPSPCPAPSPSPGPTPTHEESSTDHLFIRPQPPSVSQDSARLLPDVRDKLLLMLPEFILPVIGNGGVHVLMLGQRESKSVQREIFVSSSGAVRILVHGQDISADPFMSGVCRPKALSVENCGYFVDRIVQIVNNIRLFEICAGMDKEEFKEVWAVTAGGVKESDIFKECRYRETFRSVKCTLLVNARNWRCKECSKLQPLLKRRLAAIANENPHPKTNTRFLVEKQKDAMLSSKQKTIRKQVKTIERLQSKMKEIIAKHGVKIDKNLSNDVTEILQSANLSREHSFFLQQQLKAVRSKKSCGMRWHPTLIRLALSLYLKAPGAYRELCDSGFIKLPSSRTLFDYSHATKIEQGIDSTVLEAISKQVSTLDKDLKQYHVLMADEIHISKNLVVQKSTGDVIGFTNLDDLDKEIKALDLYFDDPKKEIEPEVATKVMAFLVKGVSSKVKDVVASYPVCNPSPKQMYMWTWDVIGALERSGVRVIAFTCDGCPMNRAFIKMNQPATLTPSGVIIDTVNKYTPERKIFFFSDVPHLIKTIRNALFNSRLHKKGTRSLQKNGEPLVWDTIIRLYLSQKERTLRKSYKLNAQNVFPDSFSRMKVKPAAQVLSRTVANDIQSQQWPRTDALVDFLRKTNDWFDLLNGAHSSHGIKTNNRRLNPYTIKDIEEFERKLPNSRFQELLDYIKYLDDWKQEILSRRSAAEISVMSELGVQPLDEGSFHALDETPHDDVYEEDSKCLLPHQTLLGIEISSRAFIEAVTFLIRDGVNFVNARVFCQDPLEQNFGKQRMGGGGSSHPSVSQYFFKQRAISIVGQLAAAKRSQGNTEIINEDSDLSSAPLPKKKKVKNDSA